MLAARRRCSRWPPNAGRRCAPNRSWWRAARATAGPRSKISTPSRAVASGTGPRRSRPSCARARMSCWSAAAIPQARLPPRPATWRPSPWWPGSSLASTTSRSSARAGPCWSPTSRFSRPQALHRWYGLLDPALAGHDPALARRLRPYMDRVLAIVDAYVGQVVERAGRDAIVAVASDHGITLHSAVTSSPTSRWPRPGYSPSTRQGIDLARTRACLLPRQCRLRRHQPARPPRRHRAAGGGGGGAAPRDHRPHGVQGPGDGPASRRHGDRRPCAPRGSEAGRARTPEALSWK